MSIKGGMGAGERVRTARRALAEVRELLLHPSPSTVERSSEILATAAESLGEAQLLVRQESAGGKQSEVLHEVEALRRDLRQARALLEHAAQVQMGWAAALGLLGSSYGARGSAGPILMVRRTLATG